MAQRENLPTNLPRVTTHRALDSRRATVSQNFLCMTEQPRSKARDGRSDLSANKKCWPARKNNKTITSLRKTPDNNFYLEVDDFDRGSSDKTLRFLEYWESNPDEEMHRKLERLANVEQIADPHTII